MELNNEYGMADDMSGLEGLKQAVARADKLIHPDKDTQDTPQSETEGAEEIPVSAELEESENESEEETQEENVEEDNTDEDIDSESEAFVEKIFSKQKKGDNVRKLRNDKYRALAEKAAAEERIKELEQMLNDSVNSGTYHYGKNAYGELERAKAAKRKALEDVDAEALIEADIALNKALNAIQDLEKWATDPRGREPYSPPPAAPVAPPPPQVNAVTRLREEMAADWLDTHPYLKGNSRKFDSRLASKVSAFVNQLDNRLVEKNQQDLYYSPEYFDIIDDYIDSIKAPSKIAASSGKVAAPVGGVRNSAAGISRKGGQNTLVKLNATDERYIR